MAVGFPCALILILAVRAPSAFGRVVPLTAPPPATTTVAWFCSGPGSTPCPAEVHEQIIDGVIYLDGSQIGLYVDDEDPTQQADVTQDRASGTSFVLAGVAQGDMGQTIDGAINSLEWYPFPAYGLTAVPPAGYASYILQAGFSWPGEPAPTASAIQQSYCGTLALHPSLIVFYYWTPASWAAVSSAKCGAATTAHEATGTRTGRGSARASAARYQRRRHRAKRRRQ